MRSGAAAGLLCGLRPTGLRSRLVCALVNDFIRLDPSTVAALAARTARLLERAGLGAGLARFRPSDVTVETGWLGAGYGYRTPEAEAARRLLREREGLALEPVYTAKALAAALALNRAGRFGDGPVLYWHTYGVAEGAS